MEKRSATQHEHLEHLFEMELQFQQEVTPITSPEDRAGKYVGSGNGTVKGSRIHGAVRWYLYEEREEALCRSSLAGRIETNDGAQIQFDSRGFFIQPDPSNPNKWITSASVRFDTADHRYEWLNRLLAVWGGEFDMETFRHHYQVYAQVIDLPGGPL
jgi:hypothetical protein